MNPREKSLTQIADRIKRDRIEIGLKSFIWNENITLGKENTPAIFMIEGRDIIKKLNSRNKLGYPARREMEVEIGMGAKDKESLWDIYQKTRRAIFCTREDSAISTTWTPNNAVEEGSFIVEIRVNEPVPYKDPITIGMSLIISLSYIDNGISQKDFLKIIK